MSIEGILTSGAKTQCSASVNHCKIVKIAQPSEIIQYNGIGTACAMLLASSLEQNAKPRFKKKEIRNDKCKYPEPSRSCRSRSFLSRRFDRSQRWSSYPKLRFSNCIIKLTLKEFKMNNIQNQIAAAFAAIFSAAILISASVGPAVQSSASLIA